MALLRGINIGRNKRVTMPQLQPLLSDLGCRDVATYLQSGNAVFTIAGRSAARLEREIGAALAERMGFEVPVLVRTRAEIARVLRGNPLIRPGRDGAYLQVTFLTERPDPARVRNLRPSEHAPDEFRLGDREIYLWCPSRTLASKIPMELWDKRFGLTTTRNWNTMLALGGLLGLQPGRAARILTIPWARFAASPRSCGTNAPRGPSRSANRSLRPSGTSRLSARRPRAS